VSETAKDFVKECLTVDPTKRPNAADMLKHSWLSAKLPHFVPDPESPTGGPTDLLPFIQKRLDARTRCKCPARTICHRIGHSYDFYVQSAAPCGELQR
jgi:serine/threonine protein kinase